MEWWIVLTIIVVLLLSFLLSGLPVAFAFLLINLIGVYFWMGGIDAVYLVAANVIQNVGQFALVAVPMFTFLGEIMWQTGVATRMINALGKWIGGMKGSLSLLAIAAQEIIPGRVPGSHFVHLDLCLGRKARLSQRLLSGYKISLVA